MPGPEGTAPHWCVRGTCHKYLVRGHTFLPNDTDFGQIEKRKKSATVYPPEDWFRVVRESNQLKPFIVREMKQLHFKDWTSFLNSRYMGNNKLIIAEWVSRMRIQHMYVHILY